jgi:hypothetical protein
MSVLRHFGREWEEKTEPVGIPAVEQEIFILLRLKEGDAMDFISAKRATIKCIKQTMQMPTQFIVEAGKKLGDLLLCDRGREIDIPDGQAGKGFRVAREQAMEEGGTAAQISQDEERLFDRLCFVSRKENVIQKETEPVHQSPQGPDQIKQQQKDQTFARELSRCVAGGEERAICCSPEEAKIVSHRVKYPWLACIKKARWGFLYFYSIRNYLITDTNCWFRRMT